jgi:Aspartyl protease
LSLIALLENNLDEAQLWLDKAMALGPDSVTRKIMRAEVWYRRNEFARSAATLSGVDPQNPILLTGYSTLNVDKLAAFKGQTPYDLEGGGESTRVKFVKSEPLPLIQVRINGGPEKIFFIDTGGSDLLLDSEFAKELGVKPLGSVQGTFSGGRHAQLQNGRIDSLALGDWKIKNVPSGMVPLRSLSKDFGVDQIDGCVRTNVLYQFLSTIDYPAGELILRKNPPAIFSSLKLPPPAKTSGCRCGCKATISWSTKDKSTSFRQRFCLSTPAWRAPE